MSIAPRYPFTKDPNFWLNNLAGLDLYGINFSCPINKLKTEAVKLPDFPYTENTNPNKDRSLSETDDIGPPH